MSSAVIAPTAAVPASAWSSAVVDFASAWPLAVVDSADAAGGQAGLLYEVAATWSVLDHSNGDRASSSALR